MSKWRKKKQEPIIFVDLNNPPNYKSLEITMLKYHNEKDGVNASHPTLEEVKRAKQLFIRNSLNWIENYIYIIDKNDETHIQLLGKYLFYFVNQINSRKYVEMIDQLLNKYCLNLNLLICKELFCAN